jgi:methylmalonyl-CoA mutase C-terminal domain/subunit
MSNGRLRILIAKPGLDGHDRGAKVVTLALRDAGFEVIYTGLHQTVDHIVETALQEDVDVVGLSILSGAHLPLTERTMARLREEGMDDVHVIVGGNIPARDKKALAAMGVSGVFPTGSDFREIVAFMNSLAVDRQSLKAGGS